MPTTDARERRQKKERYGMQVTNRSVFTILHVIVSRAQRNAARAGSRLHAQNYARRGPLTGRGTTEIGNPAEQNRKEQNGR